MRASSSLTLASRLDDTAAVRALGATTRWRHAPAALALLLAVAGTAVAAAVRWVDRIAARGIVRPGGDSIRVQSVVTGRLRELCVREGATVEKDQVLFRIAGDEVEAQIAANRQEQEAKRLEHDLVIHERALLAEQQESEAKQDETACELASDELARTRVLGERARAALREAELALGEQQAQCDRTTRLVADQVLATVDGERERSRLRVASLQVERARSEVTLAEQDLLVQERGVTLKQHQRIGGEDARKKALAESDRRVALLAQELVKLSLEERRLAMLADQLEVRAPASGTVTSLARRTAGEIVMAGETLATVAGEQAPWIVEAFVSNRDAGQLRSRIGEPVRIELDAFPYRKYGVAGGVLEDVSLDASPHDSLGMAYRVRVSLDRRTIASGARAGRIELGMTGTVEIAKERENVFELLLGQ